MADSIDREKLREAIKTARSVVDFDKSLISWELIVSAAEAHLATLPNDDTVVVCFPPVSSEKQPSLARAPDGRVLASCEEAARVAAEWDRRVTGWKHVVVQRPA